METSMRIAVLNDQLDFHPIYRRPESVDLLDNEEFPDCASANLAGAIHSSEWLDTSQQVMEPRGRGLLRQALGLWDSEF
jgi:hypothetical protein